MAMIPTNDSISMAPYPIIRAWLSLVIIFGVVPEATSEWNPEIAPHAIVTKRNGNTFPGMIGPPPWMYCVKAGKLIFGCAIITPTIRTAIVPSFT